VEISAREISRDHDEETDEEKLPLASALSICSGSKVGQLRNDLFLGLDSVVFDRGWRGKVVLATARVVNNSSGTRLKACLSRGGSFDDSQSFPILNVSSAGAANVAPSPILWSEPLLLRADAGNFTEHHVRLEFLVIQGKEKGGEILRLSAFCFLPLMDPLGTALKDGPHALVVHRVDDHGEIPPPAVYLAWKGTPDSHLLNASLQTSLSRSAMQRKMMATINTKLCSTKLTQNGNLRQDTSL